MDGQWTLTEPAKERADSEISRYRNTVVFSAGLPGIAASGFHWWAVGCYHICWQAEPFILGMSVTPCYANCLISYNVRKAQHTFKDDDRIYLSGQFASFNFLRYFRGKQTLYLAFKEN